MRFVVCTYNLWKSNRWPERREPLRQFLRRHRPDVLCLQELSPETRKLIDETLNTHARVEDPFEGWLYEGNIYWNQELFTCQAYGAEDIGIVEDLRRLFWVRLCAGSRELVVATTHFTWPGHASERKTGVSPRPAQAARASQALARLAVSPTALLFTGDLNDHVHPLWILRESGLEDVYSSLGRTPRVTRPAQPIDVRTPEVVDWLFHRGSLCPMTVDVADFYHGDLPPSDHKPLLATYRLT